MGGGGEFGMLAFPLEFASGRSAISLASRVADWSLTLADEGR
jgi:hypothetical protein